MSTEILWCYCNQDVSISPCRCDEFSEFGSFMCKHELGDDNRLPQIMDILNKTFWVPKHFRRLYLNNTRIKELKENTLKGITFDVILIDNNENLTTIHENAFIGTENVTKFIRIFENPKLKLEKSFIFNILNKFINVDLIVLHENGESIEIPGNSKSRSNKEELVAVPFEEDYFIVDNNTNHHPISRTKIEKEIDSHIKATTIDIPSREKFPSNLYVLRIDCKFIKINSYAFSSLNSLRYLIFDGNYFESIPENAFTFDNVSDETLDLIFYFRNHINGLNEKSLLNINRPTTLNLTVHNQPKSERYLDESVYLPFLLDNPKNTIKICFIDNAYPPLLFNCDNPRNFWFQYNKDLVQRVKYCERGILYASCS